MGVCLPAQTDRLIRLTLATLAADDHGDINVVVNFHWGLQKVSWDEELTLLIPTWCNRKDFIQMHKQVVL